MGVISKVHIEWNPPVTLDDFGRDAWPRFRVVLPYGMDPIDQFVYKKVPFDGFNVDGTPALASGKQADEGKK